MKDALEILVAAVVTVMGSLAAGGLLGLVAVVAYKTFKALA